MRDACRYIILNIILFIVIQYSNCYGITIELDLKTKLCKCFRGMQKRRGSVFKGRDVGQLRKIIIRWSFTELRNAYQASRELHWKQASGLQN